MSSISASEKKRIGLLLPSSNTVIEVDCYKNVPLGYSVHAARMFMEDTTVEGESRMLDEFALPAARDLATTKPHVVIFGCTSAGALRGDAYDTQLCQKISNLTGAPTVSVIKSVREKLQEISATRLVVITPYVNDLNNRIKASLEDDGFEIMSIHGLGISNNFQIAEVSGDEIFRFAEQAIGKLRPDALFVSCTNFPAVSILAKLRGRFPFPVITSNQVALETALKVIKCLVLPTFE